MYRLYGNNGSGSAAVEIALLQCQAPFEKFDAYSTADTPATQALRQTNPLVQVPTLQLPDGSVLTESAAILIYLGLEFPAAGLLPDSPSERAQALRGLVFISANCYSAIGIIDYPERWLPEADEAALEQLRAGTRARLYWQWETFADQFANGAGMGGPVPSALDMLAAVVSKWAGTREHLAQVRPAFARLLGQLDQQPLLARVFAEHGVFDD